jgi:hypothetical protein
VNDVNSEIERLEHSISSMRNQIEKYKGQVKCCAVLIGVVVVCSAIGRGCVKLRNGGAVACKVLW